MKPWLKHVVCEIENNTRTPEFSYCYLFPFLLSCLYKIPLSFGSPTIVDGKKRSRLACRPQVEVVWNGAWLAAATNRHVWQEPGPEALEEPALPSFAEEIFLQCAPTSSIYPACTNTPLWWSTTRARYVTFPNGQTIVTQNKETHPKMNIFGHNDNPNMAFLGEQKNNAHWKNSASAIVTRGLIPCYAK